MPVETATYVADLDPTLPNDANAVQEGSRHLRLLKTILKNSFPNVDGIVTASHQALSRVATCFDTDGYLRLKPPTGRSFGGVAEFWPEAGGKGFQFLSDGPNFVARSFDGTPTTNLQRIFYVDGDGNMTVDGDVNVAGVVRQGGAVLIPSGVIVMWSGNPTTVPAGWRLCNGTNGTPDLRDRFILGAGPGGFYTANTTGGAPTWTANTTANGGHSHGGATSSAGAHSHGGSTGAHALTEAQMPAHAHAGSTSTDGTHSHSAFDITAGTGIQGGGTVANTTGTTGPAGAHAHSFTTDTRGSSQAHSHTISGEGGHTHGITAEDNHVHSVTVQTIPPYYALAFIMKV